MHEMFSMGYFLETLPESFSILWGNFPVLFTLYFGIFIYLMDKFLRLILKGGKGMDKADKEKFIMKWILYKGILAIWVVITLLAPVAVLLLEDFNIL